MSKDYTWIKLHRKLLDNPIMKNPNLLQMFIYCLLRANHKPNEIIFNGKMEIIQKGSFVTGRFEMAKALKMNPASVYKNLKKLELLKYISLNSNNKFTMLTVINYSSYQSTVTTKEQQSNNKVTTKEQQSNTNKNDKNEENDKNDKKKDLPEKAPAKNLQNELRLIFEEYYLVKKKLPYHYSGKDAGCLKQLINKINFLLSPEKKNDEGLVNAFKYILLNLNDDWVLENLDLSIINSKFQQIIDKIKNGKSSTANKNGVSISELNKRIFSQR